MMHSELPIKINTEVNALRAVVELHKPEQNCFDATCYCKDSCSHCRTTYPCPTIQAIEKEVDK